MGMMRLTLRAVLRFARRVEFEGSFQGGLVGDTRLSERRIAVVGHVGEVSLCR